MPLHPRPVVRWNPGEKAWETTCRGYSVLSDPWLNKGTAFPESERAALGLTGLLPSRVLTLDQQAQRAYKQCSQQASDLDKNVYLTALHDRNEVLFYRVLTRPPQRTAAHRLHPDDRRGHPAVQPPVPPPTRRLSQHRRAGPDRDRPARHRAVR